METLQPYQRDLTPRRVRPLQCGMDWLNTLLTWLLPVALTGLLTAAAVIGARRLLTARDASQVQRSLTTIGIVMFGLILLALVAPLETDTRGQLLSLFGLVVTGVIGLASTTFVSNAMAGFMLRSVASFHAGDFIRVGEHFGRVTETALLHTEIQSEDRDLITLPNLFLITQPVRVVRTSGTLISSDVSLGYDVSRRRIRELLEEAANDAELSDPFVQITELGDFSVGYRVSGFLEDVRNLVSKRTELKARILDRMHEAGVEIVSPSFMNQRPMDPSKPVIPRREHRPVDNEEMNVEQLMFDKAEMAARGQRLRQQRDKLLADIKTLQENPDDNAFEIQWRERQVESLSEIIETLSTEPLEIS